MDLLERLEVWTSDLDNAVERGHELPREQLIFWLAASSQALHDIVAELKARKESDQHLS